MGGKVKPSPPARRGAVLRPVASGWEKWGEDEAGTWLMRAQGPEAAALDPAAGDLFAVPVRRAFSVSLWVPADDPTLFADLVFTQLELRGLAGRGRGQTTFSWEEIDREGNEALLHATVLPANLDARFWNGAVTDYVVSPLCLPLLPDGLTLWLEEGVWVAAVTRGGKLLHFQTLAEPGLSGQMALEVWLLLASLEAGGMLARTPEGRLFHQTPEPPDLASWTASGGIPLECVPLPPPVRPPDPPALMPLPVREAQAARKAGLRRRKIALAAAAGYFVLVLVAALYTGFLAWREHALRAAVAAEAGDVAQVKRTMDTWRELLPAIDPKLYPLEVLYQISNALPADGGVQLTQFQMSPREVLINGEVTGIPVALRFQEAVTQNKELAEFFDWTSDQVVPTGKGNFRFQMRGVSRVAPSDDESEVTGESADI